MQDLRMLNGIYIKKRSKGIFVREKKKKASLSKM